MKPALSNFLIIEKAIAQAVGPTIEGQIATATAGLVDLWKRTGNIGVARQFVDGFTLRDLSPTAEHVLHINAVSAVLFGSALQTGNVAKSYVLGLEREAVLRTAQRAVDLVKASFAAGGSEAIRKALHGVLDELEGRTGDQYAIFKAELSIDEFADRVNAQAYGTGRAIRDIAANVTTSRLVAYGFLSEAVGEQVTQYQWDATLDERTCPVCLFLHGQVFDLPAAYAQLQDVLGTDDTEQLKSKAPWPKQDAASLSDLYQMDPEDIQAAGFAIPPAHPNCRCVLVPVGSVDESTKLTDQEIEAQQQLFDALANDTPPTPQVDDLWGVVSDVSDPETKQILYNALVNDQTDLVQAYFDTGVLSEALQPKKPLNQV